MTKVKNKDMESYYKTYLVITNIWIIGFLLQPTLMTGTITVFWLFLSGCCMVLMFIKPKKAKDIFKGEMK